LGFGWLTTLGQLGAGFLHRQAQAGLPVFFAQGQQFEQGDQVFFVLVLPHALNHHGGFAYLRDYVRSTIGRHVFGYLRGVAFEV